MKVINPVDIDANAPATYSRAGTAWYWDYAGTLQSAGTNVLRVHWDKATGDYLGVLIEPAATNLLLNNTALSTQTRTVSNGASYTVSFYGTGSITLSGAATGATTGTGANVRTTRTFTAGSTSLTLTVSGSVTYAQLELGTYASSVIVTAGASVTRNADVISGYGTVYNSFTDATAAYNAGTAYALGNVIQYGGRLYESLQAANTGNTPDASPTWWLDTGPTMVTAAFDGQVGTVARGGSQEEVIVIKTATVTDAVGLFGMDNVDYVQVIISMGLMTGQETLYKTGRPAMAYLQATTGGYFVTLLVNNGFVGAPPPGYDYSGIGEIVIGEVNQIGETSYGAGLALIDYSRKTTDEFGVTTFVERPYAKRLTVETMVDKADFNTVTELLFSLRATPTVWVADDDADYSSAITYGFLRDMRAVIAYPTASLYSLEIEGLT